MRVGQVHAHGSGGTCSGWFVRPSPDCPPVPSRTAGTPRPRSVLRGRTSGDCRARTTPAGAAGSNDHGWPVVTCRYHLTKTAGGPHSLPPRRPGRPTRAWYGRTSSGLDSPPEPPVVASVRQILGVSTALPGWRPSADRRSPGTPRRVRRCPSFLRDGTRGSRLDVPRACRTPAPEPVSSSARHFAGSPAARMLSGDGPAR